MAINDLLSDLLIRIKNGQKAHLASIIAPYSNLSASVLAVLEKEGYIRAWSESKENNKRNLEVELKYFEGSSAIKSIKRISKPRCRAYSSVSDLKPVYNGLGVAILSTNKGVISDNDARLLNVGGEVLCKVF
jgi:small subunit ribosomal protein S8